jgi:hypothetical protein
MTDSAQNLDLVKLTDAAAWKAALASPRPVLAHLNADTTWLLQLPRPATPPGAKSSRSHFNILLDPWLQGPQSDVASWFSTQWHVVAPSVKTISELEAALAEVDTTDPGDSQSHIDLVVISHEFTDHCHRATLLELPKDVPVIATDKAADLIRSWKHFDTVITTPPFAPGTAWRDVLRDGTGSIPPWIGVGRVVTEGNALYYHSAVLIAFDLQNSSGAESKDAEAVIYSPHGIKGSDLASVRESGLRTLALLHGLHDVRITMMAQLNLGALNGVEAARVCGAKYWIATHDEAKQGGGLISWLLRRTVYTLRDAVEAAEARLDGNASGNGGDESEYQFVELGSGDVLVLA